MNKKIKLKIKNKIKFNGTRRTANEYDYYR